MPPGSRIVLRAAAEADIPTPDTDQSALFMDADAANAPAYKDDGGTVHSLEGTPGADAPPTTSFDAGTSGAAYEFDLADGDVQLLELDDDPAITFTGWPTAPDYGILRAWFTQGSGGPHVPTFGAEPA